ncbi:MAG TPA: amino acid permease [Planktothrix sp.]|jgi:APA family basic amino acid/polyamine antiporter
MTESGHFTRALGLVDSTALVVGSMIGSGIFIVSAETARNLGSPAWLLVAWALAGVLTVLAALCYGELASMYPHAGGQYIFLREAYGKLAGFLYGWTLFMVIQCGTIAAVAVGFAKFLGVLAPPGLLTAKNVLFSAGHWSFNSLQAVALVMIAVLTALNARGVKTGAVIQTTFTVAKTSALALLIILGFVSVNKYFGLPVNMQHVWQAQDVQGQPLAGFGLMGVLALAMVGPLFSCDAWNNVTFAGDEVKDASRTLAKSLMFGTMIVSFLYILANIAYLLLIPLHGTANGADVVARGLQYADQDRVGTAAAEVIFGPIGASLMAVAIVISTFGANNGLILSGPRAYYAMARDGLFFKKAGELHPKTNVPLWGLIIQGIWSAILTTTGEYGDLLDYVVFAALMFYVLTVFALIRLRMKRPEVERPVKVPGYPLVPIVYIIAAAAIMLGQICLKPTYPGFSLLIIVSGLPFYFIWSKLNSRTKATSSS